MVEGGESHRISTIYHLTGDFVEIIAGLGYIGIGYIVGDDLTMSWRLPGYITQLHASLGEIPLSTKSPLGDGTNVKFTLEK